MKVPKMVGAMNYIDDDLVSEAIVYKKRNSKHWVKWVSIAACFCILILGTLIWRTIDMYQNQHGAGTLPGADEVYPMVMVDGKLYEWRRGKAVCDALPENCDYYGQVKYVGRSSPEGDCEFASTFVVNGDIYTSQEDKCVYIWLSTDWLVDTIIVFDLLQTG